MHHCKDSLGEVFFQILKDDKLEGSKMSVGMSMSVSWITSYFYTHRVGATQHLEPMEWVKFQAFAVVRRSLGLSEPSSLL